MAKDTFTEFRETEMDAGDSIFDYVLVNGDEQFPYATTYGDYITRVWPESSQSIEVIVEALMNANSHSAPASRFGMMSPDGSGVFCSRFVSSDDGLDLRFEGSPALVADTVEVVTWLSATLLTSPNNEFEECDVCLKRSSGGNIPRLKLSSVISARNRQNDESSCWKPVLRGSVSAATYATPTRPSGKPGLELSFELMCFLCGLLYESIEDGGLVLVGPRSLVYPVYATPDYVQWHFQVRDPLDADLHLPPDFNTRRILNNLSALRKAKHHYLGMWGNSIITLGSSDSAELSKLGRSTAEELKKEYNEESRSFGGIFGWGKGIQATYTSTAKVFRTRKTLAVESFKASLDLMKTTPVLLYSPAERRAWMVPFANVLLYLVRARVRRLSSPGMDIPACGATGNGGLAAFQVLEQYLKDPPRVESLSEEQKSAEKDRAETGQHIKDIWGALDQVRRESYRVTCFLEQRSYLVGYEMADVVEMELPARMKRHRLKDSAYGWLPLLDEVPLALFYEGISDPIVPDIQKWPNSFCANNAWQTLPTGYNLLAASLPCLMVLAREFGNDNTARLTTDYWWFCPMPEYLFSFCKKKHPSHSCPRLQELQKNSRESGRLKPPDRKALLRNPNGTVIFRCAEIFAAIEDKLSARARSNGQRQKQALIARPQQSADPPGPYPENVSDSGYSSMSRIVDYPTEQQASRPSSGRPKQTPRQSYEAAGRNNAADSDRSGHSYDETWSIDSGYSEDSRTTYDSPTSPDPRRTLNTPTPDQERYGPPPSSPPPNYAGPSERSFPPPHVPASKNANPGYRSQYHSQSSYPGYQDAKSARRPRR